MLIFDIRAINEDKQAIALTLLVQPQYVGCDHLRLILQNPEQYEIPTRLIQDIISAFWEFLWNRNSEKNRVLHYTAEDLEINNNLTEWAILKILTGQTPNEISSSKDGCKAVGPLIRSEYTNISVFVVHSDLVQVLRIQIAEFLSALPPYIPISTLFHQIQILGQKHLNLTLTYLANGKNEIQLKFHLEANGNDPQTGFATSKGAIAAVVLITCILLAVVIGLLYRWNQEKKRKEVQMIHLFQTQENLHKSTVITIDNNKTSQYGATT